MKKYWVKENTEVTVEFILTESFLTITSNICYFSSLILSK